MGHMTDANQNGLELVNPLMLIENDDSLELDATAFSDDPMRDLLEEFSSHDFEKDLAGTKAKARPHQVAESASIDRSWYMLNKQMDFLKENLMRLNTYLTDLDDNFRR